ncbi:hemolysin [Tannerella forsythia]|uniref:lysophospholipid acyltransferase family protein n=1 Tax=Tannerella forsythia TaxID=28112 RepID=UPI00094FC569|nr:lysophospholipid acyltransferase family protein [Tannerella forsythia]OLQ21340.1 hemolysin [Tannerella forsythia]
MKKTVLDIDDLQRLAPVFKKKWVAFLAKQLMKWLNIDKVNTIHARYSHLRGAEFTSAILADPMMDVKYRIHHSDRLETLPEGAFITVSNHPIGSLDGIMLIDIFASRRKDFCVMVNGILEKIGAMADNFIAVVPKTGGQSAANPANVNGVRASLERLNHGHPMGFFPAGAMSFRNREGKVLDLPWTHSVIRLIRKAGVPVYPVYFDCRNSKFFYWLGQINWKIRLLRVPTEAFNKRGKTLDVHIGQPIEPEIIRSYTDDKALADFLYRTTYGQKG